MDVEFEVDPEIDAKFPRLTVDEFRPTSPQTLDYNCFAWAVGDDTRWWDTDWDHYWPQDVPMNNKLESFIKLFQFLWYEITDNSNYEDNYEKVGIYTENDKVTHAARQLISWKWTSKLWVWNDIEHNTLSGLEGMCYGKCSLVMKRIRR